MVRSIEFSRIYIAKNLSTLDPKDYLVYQVDIRCLRRVDFKDMLGMFYAQESVQKEFILNYQSDTKRQAILDKTLKKRMKRELVLYDRLTLQVLSNKPSDNLYSLTLEKGYWGRFKRHVIWGSLFGTYHQLIGNTINFLLHLMLLALTTYLGYTLYTEEYFTTNISLPFLLLVSYLGVKSITMFWLFSTLRMREALEKLLLHGFYLSTSRSVVTLDTVILLAGVVLIAIF